MVNAVVLAGGKQKFGHYKSKAAVEFNNKRCIDYVVDALDNARNIDDLIIVGDRESLGNNINKYKVTQERGTFTENAVTAGYEYFRLKLDDGEPLFFIFSDIPFVSPESIDDFIDRCDFNADINIGLADIKRIKERFPGYKKRYPLQNFNGYGFRMCNCGLANVSNIIKEGKDKLFDRAYKARRFDEFMSFIRFLFLTSSYYAPAILKNFKSLDGINGFFKGILNNEIYLGVSIEDVEGILYKKTNLDFRIIKSKYPELAVDIDTLKDKEYIENHPRFRR